MEYFFTGQPSSDCFPSSSASNPHQDGSKEKKKGATNSNGRKGTSGNGVKLSTDPQSVAARERRHRISNRFKILQSLVPGGSKMDTVSMLEGAINYVKFLQAQLLLHQTIMSLDDPDHLSPNSHDHQFPAATAIPLPPQHQPPYLDTMDDRSFPELKISDSFPLPEYSCFQGIDEAQSALTSTSTYAGAGCLRN